MARRELEGLEEADPQELDARLRLGHAERWMEAWVVRAQEVTVRRLRDTAEAALASDRLDPAELPALPAEPGADLSSEPAGVQIRDEPRGSARACSGTEPTPSDPDSPLDSAREPSLRELRRLPAWREAATSRRKEVGGGL